MLAFEDANPVVGAGGIQLSSQVDEFAVVKIRVADCRIVSELHISRWFDAKWKTGCVGNHTGDAAAGRTGQY